MASVVSIDQIIEVFQNRKEETYCEKEQMNLDLPCLQQPTPPVKAEDGSGLSLDFDCDHQQIQPVQMHNYEGQSTTDVEQK